jgi:hypothetical protein
MTDKPASPRPASPQSKKQRSPNYPAFSLEHAISKVSLLYAKNKRFPVPMTTAIEQMDYRRDSSTGQQAIAALKAFALLEDQGSGENRKVQVTDLAMKIILGHADKKMLRDAALAPALNAEVWGKFFSAEDGLAPDQAIFHYLVFDRDGKFNPESAPSFIAQLKNTARFAGLDTSTALQESADTSTDEGSEKASASLKTPSTSPPANPQFHSEGYSSTAETRSETFSLDKGEVYIRWPAQITLHEFEDIEQWLDILKRKIKRGLNLANTAGAE